MSLRIEDRRWNRELEDCQGQLRGTGELWIDPLVPHGLGVFIEGPTAVLAGDGRVLIETGISGFLVTRHPDWPCKPLIATTLGVRVASGALRVNAHPNIMPVVGGVVCTFDPWRPSTQLIDLVRRLSDLVTFRTWGTDIRGALNPEACRWVQANTHLFPLVPDAGPIGPAHSTTDEDLDSGLPEGFVLVED